MTTFINAECKKSDVETKIYKYRVAANKILQNVISEPNFYSYDKNSYMTKRTNEKAKLIMLNINILTF